MQDKRNRVGLDPKTLARGLGTVKPGAGYARLVASDNTTLAYIKCSTLTVPAALVAKAPKRLGVFHVESNGRWAGVAAADNDAARRVLEYVAQRKEEQ
jgi:hypothetical protein